MFGIDLIDASLLPAMAVALLAGVLSFLSPCVLPIIPPYLAYMGGISMADLTGAGNRRRPAVIASIFFVLGLSTVFLLLGFTASAFGRFFLMNQEVFGRIAGAVIIVFGLSQNLFLSLAALACMGAADMISVVTRHTMVQSDTPDEMRGRVSAVNSIFIGASSDLGDFRSGSMAAFAGAVPAIVFGGAMTFTLAILWRWFFPALAKRDKLVE